MTKRKEPIEIREQGPITVVESSLVDDIPGRGLPDKRDDFGSAVAAAFGVVDRADADARAPTTPPATKYENPCFVSAGDDEPIFVLRAHDALAVPTIHYWIDLAASVGVPAAKLERARADAARMDAWAAVHGCKRPD